MRLVGAARRSWAQQHPQQVVGFIRAYRDAVAWLQAPANRPAAQALLLANAAETPGAGTARAPALRQIISMYIICR